MVDARAPANAGRPAHSDSRRKAIKILSFCLKAASILFLIPTALLTKAPQEIVLEAVYITLVSAAGFFALWEITAGINRLNETLAGRSRSS